MAYRDIMRWLGHKEWFAWTAARLAPLDAKVVKKTGGKFGLLGNYGLPQCLLTTTGRKSGQQRTVTLLYGTRGDEVVLIGSNFGQQHHPAWALNLEANAAATVAFRHREVEVIARTATEAERAQVLATAATIYVGYPKYLTRISGRTVRIFVLEPCG